MCLIIIVFTLTITQNLGAAEAGMPQLDPKYWASQAFWLILIFTLLYLSLSNLFIPKIKSGIDDRENKIKNDLDEAQELKELAETKLKEYGEAISKSKLEAKAIFDQANEKALKDINTKRKVLEKQIDDEIIKVEEEIKTLRDNAPDKINKIAIETSSELIKKLIGAEVNSSSISAIVDDLCKRNGDKYYGN